MAHYEIRHACGHTVRTGIVGSHESREWRIKQLEAQNCFECYKAAQTQIAQEQAQQQELPPLHGTDAQIAWAETIRIGKLRELDSELSRSPDISDPVLLQAIERVTNTVSAHQWIEWRDASIRRILAQTVKTLEHLPAPAQPDAPQHNDALAEATVRPEHPVTETIAEIRVSEKSVEVIFPEKREDFRELVRFQLGYTWQEGRWTRQLIARNGTPEDRAAELGHVLLGAGFPVRIFSQDIRAKAVSGSYEPEQTRWIVSLISGDYAGWFALTWGKHEDCYDAARRIKGSRYASPYVVVPAEHVEEVLDFAQVHSFRLTKGAQDIADSARARRDAALTVQVERVPKRKKERADDSPGKLAVPEQVEVLAEFREAG